VRLIRDSFPQQPLRDVAVSRALLMQVAHGEIEPVLRIYRPGPTLAFGRLDALRPGFAEAAQVARGHGFEPVLRLSGGHAAAYDQGALVYEEITPGARLIDGLTDRFESVSEQLAGALRSLGLDARVGELPGEYCPGRYSVNLDGRVKVVGTAQRVIRGAALVSAVLLVRGGARLRSVLADVYAALELDWDPSTAGAIEDVDVGAVEDAVLATRPDVITATLAPATLELDATLQDSHRIDGIPRHRR
jgi:octanoyl-[GcvH]:protein N-octanoyltransferase